MQKNYTNKSEIINEYIPQDEIKNLIQEDLPFIKAENKKDGKIKFNLPGLELLKKPSKKERDGIGIQAAKKWAIKNKIKKVAIQGPGNLGTKMKRQFLKAHFEKTISHKTIHKPVLLIGTDLPSISHFDLIQAIQILNQKEMVLGPSKDGGYWLIGLSNKLLNPLCTWPFSGISWGSDKVLKETIRLASLNQIDYQLLQTKNDLDNVMDLSTWLDYKSFQVSASSYQL